MKLASRASLPFSSPRAALWDAVRRAWLSNLNEDVFLRLTLISLLFYLFEIISHAYLPPVVRLPHHFVIWWIAIGAFIAYVLILAVLAWRRPVTFTSDRSKRLQVVCSSLFFAIFFFLYGNPESNLSLAFLLPLILSIRYFSPHLAIQSFLVIILLMGGTLAAMDLLYNLPETRPLYEIFFVQSVLFTSIACVFARSEFLFRQLNLRNSEYRRKLHLLVAQGRGLARRRDLDTLLETATRVAIEELRAETAALFLFRHGRFHRQKIKGLPSDFFDEESYGVNEGLTGSIELKPGGVGFGRVVYTNAAETDSTVIPINRDKYTEALRSHRVAHIAAAPLQNARRTFGILRIVNKVTASGEIDSAGFTEDDREMLSTIAAQVALVYETARREATVQAAFDVTATLARPSDEDQVCQRIAEAIVAGAGHGACSVWLREASGGLRLAALHGLSREDGQRLRRLPVLHSERLTVLDTGARRSVDRLGTCPDDDAATWARDRRIASALLLPLMHQERVTGILEIYSENERDFYADEIGTLEGFASQAAISLINTRLSQEHREYIGNLKELSGIVSRMMSSRDRDDLLDDVVGRAAALLEAEDCSIYWLDRATGTFALAASSQSPQHHLARETTLPTDAESAGLLAYFAQTRRPLSYADGEHEDLPTWSRPFIRRFAALPSRRCLSLVSCPIIDRNDDVIGVVLASNKSNREGSSGFSPADEEMVAILANQIAVSAEKLDQIRALERLNQVAQTITDAGGSGANGSSTDVLLRIAENACAATMADLAVIRQIDSSHGSLVVERAVSYGQRTDATHHDTPREDGITRTVLAARSGFLVIEDFNDYPELVSDFTRDEDIRSLIAVSLKVRSAPVGVLYLNYRRPHRFTEDEIRNSLAFGELAAVAIQNSKLFTKLNTTVRELRAAQELTRLALQEDALDKVVDVVVKTICDEMHFEFCSVSLVDEASKTIETVKAKGAAEDWAELAKHDLAGDDIQAYIVRTGATEIMEGWDTHGRFDPDIYDRFGHERYIRIFTPIFGRGRAVIGTVEAGHDRSRKARYTENEIDILKEYLKQVSLVIGKARLLEQARSEADQLQALHNMSQELDRAVLQGDVSNVLQLAADLALGVTGPGASIALYLGGDQSEDLGNLEVLAARGADQLLLSAHAVARYRDHRSVLASGELRRRDGRFSPDGEAPSACLPLQAGGAVLGTLCVAYNRDHWFTQRELHRLDLCAKSVALAITHAKNRQMLVSNLNWLSVQVEHLLHSPLVQWVGSSRRAVAALLNDGPPEQSQQRERVLQQVERRLRLTENEFLRLSQIRKIEQNRFPLKTEPVDLHPFVSSVSDGFREEYVTDLLKNQVVVLDDFGDFQSTVAIDSAIIEQIIVELMKNAVRFSPPGGVVQVVTAESECDVFVSVVDIGRGIDPSLSEKIFERFVQLPPLLSNERMGSGQGLFLARQLMMLSGGSLELTRSHPGEGSMFTLSLPKLKGDQHAKNQNTGHR